MTAPSLWVTVLLCCELHVSAGEITLFNGNDLAGWEGNPALWSVQDGAITGVTKADPKLTHNTFLVYTNGEFGDFELRLSYRIVNGNSGIQYRSAVQRQGPFGPVVGGYQADFEAGKTYSGILYEERGRGILAQRGQKTVIKTQDGKHKVDVTGTLGKSEDIQAKIKHEDWNDYLVIARRNHLQHFINGMQTVDVLDEDQAKAATSGIIALQIHTGPPMTVQFKNIRLQRLDAAAARSDLDTLQGRWVPVEILANGAAVEQDEIQQVELTVQGRGYSVVTRDGEDGGSFQLNEAAHPKAMDVKTRDGSRVSAIYELAGDRLRVCYAPSDFARPTGFSAEADSHRVMAVYQRVQ